MTEEMFYCFLHGDSKYGYDNPDALEYHLRKEHTKNDMLHYLKLKALSFAKSNTEADK